MKISLRMLAPIALASLSLVAGCASSQSNPAFVPAPGRNPAPQNESRSGNSTVQPGQLVAPNR
jgi:hypothetical protein